MKWKTCILSIGGAVSHAPGRLTRFRRPFMWLCFVTVAAVIYLSCEIHHRFFRACVIANVSEEKHGIQYAAEDFRTLCSQENYPDSFRLETNGGDVLIGDACAENIYELHAHYNDNKLRKQCKPWVDIQGRILGPGLNKMPKQRQYYLNFQSVKINHVENGLFEVVVPNVEPGEYWMELLVTHDFRSLGTMYGTETYTNKRCLACVDYAVINTPIRVTLIENDRCVMREQTPLCGTGKEPGRWVTLPESGCDGVLCEGDINILESSGRVWAPYECHYKLYSPHELKSCTESKNLLFIGDSLIVEIADAMLQLELFDGSLPLIWELTKRGAVINREADMRQWRRPWDNDVWFGFDFIFGDPLGCGIACVTQMSDEELKRRLTPHGGLDILVLFTGVHDIAPINRSAAKNYDVFERYKLLLPLFIEKISKLMKSGGRIMWMLAPWTSDLSRCDYLSKPRLALSNTITRAEVEKHPHVTLIDYFQVTESCFCGDIHKGNRFHHSVHADKHYNGFAARMVVHQLLTLLCAR
ncbi:uncharacterized protein LOC144359406 [Saccoglossus kowalevskii]